MDSPIFIIKDQVALRLRDARDALSLKPMDLAIAAGVSKATQYNYENGQTPPDVNYLRKVQTLGVDIPYVLFNNHADQFTTKSEKDRFDWDHLEKAIAEVETFCVPLNETCPPRIKAKLIRQFYEISKTNNVVSKKDVLTLVREMWHHR